MKAIYSITNTITGKLYIGSAYEVKARWACHLSTLRNNKHHSPHLQRSWNIHGESAFVFDLVETGLDEAILVVREQYWMDYYQSYDPSKGYNVNPIAGRVVTPWMKGKQHTPESKKKISDSGKGKVRSEESKKRYSDARKKMWADPEYREKTLKHLRYLVTGALTAAL
jgi:group I intron endonuclease